MKLMYDDKGTCTAIVLETKAEMKSMVEICAHAIAKSPQTMNKRSNAYKMAMQIDGELPIF